MMANPWKRRFTAPPRDQRCVADVTLRDGSGAQCMRARVVDDLCRQHDRLQREKGKVK